MNCSGTFSCRQENNTVSLDNWVALSALLESLQLQGASNGDGNSIDRNSGASAHVVNMEVKLAYAERACKVALLLLHQLTVIDIPDSTEDDNELDNQSNAARRCTYQAEDLSLDKFCVKFSPPNPNEGEASISVDINATIEKALGYLNNKKSKGGVVCYNYVATFEESEIKCVLEDSAIDVATVGNLTAAGITQKQRGNMIHKLGILLYQIFARGETPELHKPEEEAKNQMEDPVCDESQEDEEKESGREPPRKNLLHFSVKESLSEKGVPWSLCRLVADLIDPNEDDGTPFVSLDEVVQELKQILERPDIFFHDVSWLDFSSGLIGRSEEIQLLHQEAALVQMGGGQTANRLVLLKGFPGSGKSFLASCFQAELTELGWLFVQTKFDRFVQNPLLTIASSFDQLLASLEDEDEEEENHDIVRNLETVLSASAIVTLSEWLPSLHHLFPHIFRRVISDEDLVSLAEDSKTRCRNNDITSNSESAKSRLHYIFRKLVSALSSPDRPLLILFDDLQWADNSCLDLISSLLIDFNHFDQFGPAGCFLVICSYRANEVDSTHRLSSYLETFERSNALHVTNIHLDGIEKALTNLMISEMLGLPKRLTEALADAVHAKTLGNPLYIHTFMQSLVHEKLLVYSVPKKRWLWDIEDIQSVSIQEGIAEVLTRKISNLHCGTQDALKVMSTFGSQISEEYIEHLYPIQEKRKEFLNRLDSAVEENVIEKIGSKYKFVHDMVQQAVYELMSLKEKAQYHFQNGVQLISQLSSRKDSLADLGPITFVAIDQINNASSLGVTDVSMSTKFAKLNLEAGEKSIEVFDFIAGLSYIERGLSYLPKESRWNSSNYDLSRSLHERACLACYVNALPAKANEHISEILGNAKCLEHKLNAYSVMVKTLISSGDYEQALQTSFYALSELGETFPFEATTEIIQVDLSSTKALLNNLTKESILSSPKLIDEKKLWAMKFMNNIFSPLIVTNYRLLPLISCRMVQLSSQYGYCSESAFGFLGYGMAQISVLQDIDEGYRWGKIALSLLESFGGKVFLPKMRCLFYSYLGFWKEPFQATSNVLLQTHSEALMVGDVEYASISAFFYCRQSLVCGQNLQLAEKECKAIASNMVQLKQIQMCFGQVNCSLYILKLNGNYEKVNPFLEIFDGKIANEEELLQSALSSGKQVNVKGILSNRFQIAFWFGRYEEAAELAEKASPPPKMSFMEVYHIFFEGLIGFQLARRSLSLNTAKWMAIGNEAMTRFRFYEQCSNWNWENNLFLLEAEYHRCNQEEDKAAAKYMASIKSAQDHRCVNEEGLALEFYGDFLVSKGKLEEAREEYANARVCYEKWGAHAIMSHLEEKFGQAQGTG